MEEVVTRLGRIFAAHGKQLYLVGGPVRDELLGRRTQDIDLTTDAHPREIKRLIALARPDATFDVGERFGTVGAIFDGLKVETTTFRSERYTPSSRKPEVEFGTSLEGDLSRRDLTINAMAREVPSGALVDPFGGLRDLESRIVRAVGNPDERFAEDPLRLLRAVRFCAQLGFGLEAATREAIRRNASALRTVSRERIADEMNRLLLTDRPALGVRLLVELGLSAEAIPELVALKATSQGRRMKDVFAHTLVVLDRSEPDLVLRWSALLHDIGKPRTVVVQGSEVHFPGHELVGERIAREILTRLRLDARTTDRVARLVGLHMRANQYDESWTDGAVRRLIRDAGEDLDLLLALSTADVTSYRQAKVEAALSRVRRLRERCASILEAENVKALRSPLDGNELMAMFGRGPGPWIKAIKDYLQDLVIEGDLSQDDKARAADLARARMHELYGEQPSPASEPEADSQQAPV